MLAMSRQHVSNWHGGIASCGCSTGCSRRLQHGIDVVLDFEFWSRKLRDNARRLALSVRAEVKLYRVICDEDVARARCLARDSNPSGAFMIDT
jgi:predicted kinase